ncbi:MAG: hypothetical protein HKN32_03435 [Flavobacteriales bacterium]|nr:hypothetical protein [Flavobacteriales bacterium]
MSISDLASAQTEEQKKMPPIEMLPKKGESKKIYQLPNKCEYAVFDSKGKLCDKGEAEWIDMGKYKKGIYFIKYNGETISCEIRK